MTSRTTLAPQQAGLPEPELSSSRRARLRAVHDELVRRPPWLVELLCQISTRCAVEYEIDAAIRTLRGAFDEVEHHAPVRVDRLAAFMPSNVILYSYVLYLLVPSLYVERLEFRPASAVREQTLALHELLRPLHGLNIEARAVSQRAFVRDSASKARLVVFTGAYQNAETIRAQLCRDQVFIFLGSGVNPFVVVPGARVRQAVTDLVTIRMLNSGQDCLAPDLVLVHEAIADEFIRELIQRIHALRYGPYTNPEVDYGPVYYRDALDTTARFLSQHRDTIVHGGGIDFRSGRVEPAVIVDNFDPRTEVDEFFAPIFNVRRFSDLELLAQVLDTGVFAERALGASVYGEAPDLVRVLRRRHTVAVNATLLSFDDGNVPFGGYGPMANYVAFGGKLHVSPILISKTVAECLGAAPARDS